MMPASMSIAPSSLPMPPKVWKPAPSTKIKVECLECGAKFSVRSSSVDPECPSCGGVDVEVA